MWYTYGVMLRLGLIIIIIGILLTASARFDACGGAPEEKCVVLPRLESFFNFNYEICIIDDTGELKCLSVQQ